MKLRNLLLGAVAGLLLTASASAQVNTVPQVGLITSTLRIPTYTASSVALVPASAATDIFCMSPGTSRNISIRRITLGGTAGTAITTPFLVYRRVSLDTGGTAATGLALPVAVPNSPNDPASVSTLTAYTANPTVVDSSPSLMDNMLADLPVTTAAGGITETSHSYGSSVDFYNKGLDLIKNTTQQMCISLNGATVASGVLQITVTWQEQ